MVKTAAMKSKILKLVRWNARIFIDVSPAISPHNSIGIVSEPGRRLEIP